MGLGRTTRAGLPQSPDFRPFLEAAQPFFEDIEEMTHYEVTAHGPGGPAGTSVGLPGDGSSSSYLVLKADTT